MNNFILKLTYNFKSLLFLIILTEIILHGTMNCYEYI